MVSSCSMLAYKLWSRACEMAGYYKNLTTCTYRYDHTIDIIMQHTRQGDFIDVGTGSGSIPFLLTIRCAGIKIKGIDRTELYTANRILDNFLPDLRYRVSFQQKSIYDLDEKHDYVICTEVLEHLEDDKKAFDNLLNNTKKILFISLPSEFSSENVPGHLRRYNKDAITKLISPYTKKFEFHDHELMNHFHFVTIEK